MQLNADLDKKINSDSSNSKKSIIICPKRTMSTTRSIKGKKTEYF